MLFSPQSWRWKLGCLCCLSEPKASPLPVESDATLACLPSSWATLPTLTMQPVRQRPIMALWNGVNYVNFQNSQIAVSRFQMTARTPHGFDSPKSALNTQGQIVSICFNTYMVQHRCTKPSPPNGHASWWSLLTSLLLSGTWYERSIKTIRGELSVRELLHWFWCHTYD